MEDGDYTLVELSHVVNERVLADYRRSLTVTERLETQAAELEALRGQFLTRSLTSQYRQSISVDSSWQAWVVLKRLELMQKLALSKANELENLNNAKYSSARLESAREVFQEEHLHSVNLDKRRQAEDLNFLSLLAMWSKN